MPEKVHLVSRSWHLENVADPPDRSVSGTPARRDGSLRRTSHLSASWPEGRAGPLQLTGRARDLVTSAGATPATRDEADLELELDGAQVITRAITRPGRRGTERLVGAHAVRGFRASVESALPEERTSVTPLALLLDDVSTVAMIGTIAWSQRPDDADDGRSSIEAATAFLAAQDAKVACSGFRRDGYYRKSIDRNIMFPHWFRLAGRLETDDEWAWHTMEKPPEVCFRRRRRIDTWSEDACIAVDAHYRDSVWGPEHDEVALHEYSLQATVDPGSNLLRTISVEAHVLPFPECPSVTRQVGELVGRDVTSLRAEVQRALPGIHGCTHLNDMLRGLSDVPALLREIESVPG